MHTPTKKLPQKLIKKIGKILDYVL